MSKLAWAGFLIGLAACQGDGYDILLLDAAPPLVVCDPRAQEGCATGEKCATRTLQATPDEISDVACVPDGTVAIGGACTLSGGDVGYSSCKAGGECVNGVCRQVCDQQAGASACEASYACATHRGILQSEDKLLAGTCDPRCDPLTQVAAVGTPTAACGSPDPAAPDHGCYTRNLVDYTCSFIRPEARNLLDRSRALLAPTGAAFANGCAAGFLPIYFEQTGSMNVICMGLCAPGKTDSANPALAAGDPSKLAKLPTKAAPAAGDGVCAAGKKGSGDPENCMYMWYWNVDRLGRVLESPYNDTTGVCWAYNKYTVSVAGATHPWPRCESLPPAGAPRDPIYGNADQWPCVPSTEYRSTLGAVRASGRDVRVGGSPGPAVRHLLRQE